MKKIHWMVLKAFIWPFIIIFSILLVIFLLRFIVSHIDEISGKGLTFDIYCKLFFYFSIESMAKILALSMLFSSLMAYGSLGQYNELTAIKSAGISLLRIFFPVFLFSLGIMGISFYLNDQVIPKVNLNAYQLLWDVKQKKAAFNLKEGVFYNQIPGYSIKVDKIFPDGKTLKNVIIYDHQNSNKSSSTHIVADSGTMVMSKDESSLDLYLYNGTRNAEEASQQADQNTKFSRTKFTKSLIVLDLSSFQFEETPKELFVGNHQMMNIDSLTSYISFFRDQSDAQKRGFKEEISGFFKYGLTATDNVKILKNSKKPFIQDARGALTNAYNRSKNIEYQALEKVKLLEEKDKTARKFFVRKMQRYSDAVACVLMFFLGAPVGSVLKKGGLGIPGLVTIMFFIIYHIVYSQFEDYAITSATLNLVIGGWGAILVLLPAGIFFVYQASIDSRIFELTDGFFDRISSGIKWLFGLLSKKKTSEV